MRARRTLTVSLEESDRERLDDEATRRAMTSAALARDLIRAGLADVPESADERRRQWAKASAQMEKLRRELRESGYPSVDAVEVARRAREELEQRFHL